MKIVVGFLLLVVMMVAETLTFDFVNVFCSPETALIILGAAIAPFFEEVLRRKGGWVFTIGLILIEGVGYSERILEYSMFMMNTSVVIVTLVLIWSSRSLHIMFHHVNHNYGVIKAMIIHSFSNIIIMICTKMTGVPMLPSIIISGVVGTSMVVLYFTYVFYQRQVKYDIVSPVEENWDISRRRG